MCVSNGMFLALRKTRSFTVPGTQNADEEVEEEERLRERKRERNRENRNTHTHTLKHRKRTIKASWQCNKAGVTRLRSVSMKS